MNCHSTYSGREHAVITLSGNKRRTRSTNGMLLTVYKEVVRSAIAYQISVDLYLSHHHNVTNTNFCSEDGQILYKSETPGSPFALNQKTTISKVIPNDSPDDMSI